jgi:hypothetical protein
MDSFPHLGTNAIAQYPSGYGRSYRTEVLRFLDGTEQRYRKQPDGLRHWVIRLELLNEAETDALRRFFDGRAGRYGSFTFSDPWTGDDFENCFLESDVLDLEYRSINRSGAVVRIVQRPT